MVLCWLISPPPRITSPAYLLQPLPSVDNAGSLALLKMDFNIVGTMAFQDIGNQVSHAFIVAFATNKGKEPYTGTVL
jgi:hypothetical protein